MTLAARQRELFRVFLVIFLVALLFPKRGVLVQKNSLASCQWYSHSVKPRALTCPFKHSDLIAWSLLIGHPTHKYLWGRLCFVHVRFLLSTVTVTPAESRIMATEALLSKTVSVKIYTKRTCVRSCIPQSACAPSSRGTKRFCSPFCNDNVNSEANVLRNSNEVVAIRHTEENKRTIGRPKVN